ncbi:hit family protein 1 [Neurospora tetrasperma FGSC 2508]|uniref:Adenosine 5'-monophosphoramidase HNT1 n=2 Tax=Neurospora TaxID=5140 RepID=F8MSL1_NEUT8|nr:hit family protein 1 [Neurospora tetrasperma FGSC 2508]EGO55098.1 hit family protein 1 [Neurospora tetrasperma FGSC 2508]EGZ69693.1 hit family protein 1 [Neurospora tetrasperma FGSC 2509]
MASSATCIFCKIVKGEIPCFKLVETEKTLAFLDIQPLSRGHALVIPKHHGEKLADIPDDSLSELLPIAKKLAIASGAVDYNILQNNGKLAHQEVGHVHVHMIPKPNEKEGLIVGWPQQATDMEALKKLHAEIKEKL